MEDDMDVWYGLACPPLDDYAFSFGDLHHGPDATDFTTNLDPDVFFDQPLEEKKKEKQPIIINNFPGKELKKLALVLEQDIDLETYSKELALDRERQDKEKAASICRDADDKEGTICNKTQPQPPIRNIEEVVTKKKIVVKGKIPPAPVMKQEKKLLDANVCLGRSCEGQRYCNNKNMMKKPTIIRKHGKGKQLRKVFEVMKPLMEPDDYEKAVEYAKAVEHAVKLVATKRKVHDSHEPNNDSKKQKTAKLIEFQHSEPMSKPTIQRPKPAIQKSKPKTKQRTTWSSRLAKAVADICH